MHELRQRRPGYHRPRLIPEPESFILGDHRFETDGKDLWVTLPERPRIDRLKATRYGGSRSMKDGYPRELVRPEPMTPEFARSAAVFWLAWSQSADYARFPPVRLDHYVRDLEERELIAA